MDSRKAILCTIVVWLLSIASVAQLRQVAIIDIPGEPGFDALAWAGKYLLISHTAANSIDVFNPALRRVVARISGLNRPRGLAVDPTTARVYVANSGNNSIAVISTVDWKLHENIALAGSPDSLLLVPEWQALCVADPQQQAVSILQLGGNNQVMRMAIGGSPQEMVFDASQHLLFVTTQGPSQLAALDQKSVVHRYPLNASQPTGVVLDAAGKRLYIAARGAVLVVDPNDGAEITRIPGPQSVNALWFDPKTSSLYAAAEDGSVSLIQVEGGSYQSGRELRTQIRAHTLAYDAARQYVYLPGGREGRSKLVILKRVEAQPTAEAADQSASHQQVAEKH